MTEPLEPNRAFAVSLSGETSELVGSNARIKHMGYTDGMIAAIDVLDDAGLLTDDRAKVLVAADRKGDDAEALARKMVKLIRAARNYTR